MATQVKNLKLNDEVYKKGEALQGSLAFGEKTYNGTADQTITAEDLGVGNAYIPKGSITVSGANTGDSAATPATTWEEGWVYNMSDAGTITNGLNGSFTVLAGDNIVRVKDANDKYRWDKLAATITVPEYVGTAPVTVTDGTGAQSGKKVIAVTTGNGLQVSSDTLVVKPDASKGVVVGSDGVGVNIGNGLEIDNNSNKVQVKAKTSGAVTVSADGVEVNVDTTKGLKIDTTGNKVQVNNGNGLEFDSTSGALKVKSGNQAITVSSSGVEVNVASAGGLKVDSNGLGVKLPTDSGLSTSTNGLAVGAGNGIQVTGTAVAVKPSSIAGKTNIDADANGVFVSLNRAGNVGTGSGQIANLDNKTIGEIVTMLGGTVGNN